MRSIALASTLLVGAGVIASTYLGVHKGTPKSGDPRLLSTFPGRYARPDYSPDGSLMTFVGAQSTETPQVWVMRLDDLSPRKLTQGESPALNAVFTADGRAIVFERADAGIWRIAVDGIGGETRIVARGRNPSTSALGGLAWEDDGAIWLADGNGRQQRRLEGPLPARYADRMAPAFSPDGKRICWFQSERDTPIGRLMVADVDGATPPRVLTKAPFRGGWPEWTPDGRFILYSSSQGGATTLWSVPSDGGQPSPVTIGSGDDDHPAIRADGREIAYTNQRREFALLRRDAESGEVRALIRQQREFVLPSVSPDGNRIAYFSPVVGGKAQIFTIGADGSNPVQLTRDNNSFNMAPSWSADGTSILYYRKEPEPALAAMPANGGTSVDLAQGWTYGIQTQAQRSPDGLSVAYTLVAQGASQATRIRLLDPGTERPLARVINSPAWWPDGRSIVGTTEDQRILRCPEDGSECAEVTTGSRPIPGPFGELYFLRVEQPALHAIWRRSPDGEERRLAVLEGSAWGGFGYGVLPDGDIVWSASLPGTQEIWVTELH